MNTLAQPVPEPPAYSTVTRSGATERDTVLAIWHGNLGRVEHHAGKYEWFYFDCPYGHPLVELLWHEPTARYIGTGAIGPRDLARDHQSIRAGVLVDMAVDIEHRSLGPAMMLQSALLEAAATRFDLVYGFPNPKALPVVKRLGYEVIGHIGRYSHVLRHARYLERHMPHALARITGALLDRAMAVLAAVNGAFDPAFRVEWSDRVDPRVDALWQQSAPHAGVIAARDVRFLAWRFDAAPDARTRYLTIASPSNGALLAWFACEQEGSTLHVRDFWSTDAAAAIGLPYLRALLRAARRGGWGSIALAMMAAPAKLAPWLRARFVFREQRPVIGKWLGEGQAPAIEDWHLTAADEDE